MRTVKPLFFKRQLMMNVFRMLWQFISVLEKLKWITGFSTMGWMSTPRRYQLLHQKSYLLIVLLYVAFGHPDLQTSHHPTSSCGNFSWRAYSNSTRSLEATKHTTGRNTVNIEPQTIHNIAQDKTKRMGACRREGDGHFQHLKVTTHSSCYSNVTVSSHRPILL
jgi:hypothetical protein